MSKHYYYNGFDFSSTAAKNMSFERFCKIFSNVAIGYDLKELYLKAGGKFRKSSKKDEKPKD